MCLAVSVAVLQSHKVTDSLPLCSYTVTLTLATCKYSISFLSSSSTPDSVMSSILSSLSLCQCHRSLEQTCRTSQVAAVVAAALATTQQAQSPSGSSTHSGTIQCASAQWIFHLLTMYLFSVFLVPLATLALQTETLS